MPPDCPPIITFPLILTLYVYCFFKLWQGIFSWWLTTSSFPIYSSVGNRVGSSTCKSTKVRSNRKTIHKLGIFANILIIGDRISLTYGPPDRSYHFQAANRYEKTYHEFIPIAIYLKYMRRLSRKAVRKFNHSKQVMTMVEHLHLSYSFLPCYNNLAV